MYAIVQSSVNHVMNNFSVIKEFTDKFRWDNGVFGNFNQVYNFGEV